MTYQELRQRAINKGLKESLGLTVSEIEILKQQVIDVDSIKFSIPDGRERLHRAIKAGQVHSLNGGRYISRLGLKQVQATIDPGAQAYQEV